MAPGPVEGLVGVLPVAGRGTRMGDLTAETPKALLELGGISLLARAAEVLRVLGCERIIVVHAPDDEAMVAAAVDLGDGVQMVEQAVPLGLSHAIHVAWMAAPEATLFVLPPDSIYLDVAELASLVARLDRTPATLLQPVEVGAATQHDRPGWWSGGLPPLAADHWTASASIERVGLPLSTVGVKLLRPAAARFLPDWTEVEAEVGFSPWMADLQAAGEVELHLMQAGRYDLTTPQDLDEAERFLSAAARLPHRAHWWDGEMWHVLDLPLVEDDELPPMPWARLGSVVTESRLDHLWATPALWSRPPTTSPDAVASLLG